MTPKFRYKHWYLNNWLTNRNRRWLGITLYPYILFRDEKELVSDRLFKHELCHIYQVQRIGWIKYYVTWLYYNIRYGYSGNPFEEEARLYDNDPLTEQERKWKEES